MAELTRRQERAVLALLTEATVARAAARAHVSERQLYRWQKVPAFRTAVVAASRELFEDALAKLRAAAPDATATIRNLRQRAKSESVRLRAALAIFEIPSKIDLQDVLERVAALEQRAEEQDR